jgi:hypothetical protein
MTTDNIVSIKFQYIPCGEKFSYSGMRFIKINNNDTANCEADPPLLFERYWTFAPDFRIDMSYSHVVEILGPPTEPGVWD